MGGATTGVLNFNFEINSPPSIQNFPLLGTCRIAAQIASWTAPSSSMAPPSVAEGPEAQAGLEALTPGSTPASPGNE